ncbi:hypothetical protein MSM1_18055 [Mycobacterium sp. SM1]|uniref:hypothetical protein n=1 Tax=Mycobacterium sp. SM1 TaxID=2816243 RepID=UPI001BCBB882|nr:hypothetical protein [Mycobacterium sp. SM1]MBS4730152.1 hypothetical protein [Mycobacterium sp. SM1]
MNTETQPTKIAAARRTRRAEPITKRTAKNGTVSYEFRADVGVKPDGSRDRRRFTFPTYAEARREYRKISSQVAAGTYTARTDITVDEACDAWLAGRRGIRQVTRYSYEMDLKPVRRYLGGRKLQQLTKADGDALVRWLLTEARTSPRHYRADSLAGRVVTLVSEHPEGITAAELTAALSGGDVHSALSALLATGRLSGSPAYGGVCTRPPSPRPPPLRNSVSARRQSVQPSRRSARLSRATWIRACCRAT